MGVRPRCTRIEFKGAFVNGILGPVFAIGVCLVGAGEGFITATFFFELPLAGCFIGRFGSGPSKARLFGNVVVGARVGAGLV